MMKNEETKSFTPTTGEEAVPDEGDLKSSSEANAEANADMNIDMNDMEALYAKSLERLKEDEIVKGTVVQVTKDHVLVDVGYKSEGQIPIEEFADDDGKYDIRVGDKVDVYIEKSENENGLVVLSKEKADQFILWEEIRKACEDNEIVEGKIVAKIKGGLVVDIGVKAFHSSARSFVSRS
jgi:small subunit ribosomal protein S1